MAQQKVATLLLTLSNLVFLAPIAISVQRRLLLEASVYAYTMFFSTVGPPAPLGGAGGGGTWAVAHRPAHSSTTPAISRATLCSASSTTTRCSTVTSWALECPSGSPSSAWPG